MCHPTVHAGVSQPARTYLRNSVWIECLFSSQVVAGSNPAGGTKQRGNDMCAYTEADPEGGVAQCTREMKHYGVHLVKRKNGGVYLENLGIHKMMAGDFDNPNPVKIGNKRS
jgi:hypothetical protein